MFVSPSPSAWSSTDLIRVSVDGSAVYSKSRPPDPCSGMITCNLAVNAIDSFSVNVTHSVNTLVLRFDNSIAAS
jgi:hypothetical protein